MENTPDATYDCAVKLPPGLYFWWNYKISQIENYKNNLRIFQCLYRDKHACIDKCIFVLFVFFLLFSVAVVKEKILCM